MIKPKVSVSMLAYNHEKFISKAIESVLMQETEFDVELVIGEDNSPDNTREVIDSYVAKHPDKIKALYRDNNVGARQNGIEVWEACQGDYIAYLDGDDYWTDPLKLQKQADFMDKNPGCTICFTKAESIVLEGEENPRIMAPPEKREFFNLAYILITNPFCTSTSMYKNHLWEKFPDWFVKDWSTFVMCALKGDIGYIDDLTTIYRIHHGGIHSTIDVIDKYQEMIDTRKLVFPVLDKKHQELVLLSNYNSFKKMMRESWKRHDYERGKKICS